MEGKDDQDQEGEVSLTSVTINGGGGDLEGANNDQVAKRLLIPSSSDSLSSSKRSSLRPSFGGSVRKVANEYDNLIERVHLAIWPHTDKDELSRLLDANPILLSSRYGKNEDTLLHRTVRHGKTQLLSFLLKRKGLDINAQNCSGRTALHLAAHTLREEIVDMLQEAGADANILDCCGDAPMHLACKAGSLPILRSLLLNSLCHDPGCPGGQGNTLLHYAARFGNLDVMNFLIDECGVDVNARNHLTETPLHLASGVHKMCLRTKALEFLIEHGADPHVRTVFGDTAAHYAALGGTLWNLQYLVETHAVSMCKNKGQFDKNADDLCQKLGLTQDTCKEMKLSFLQKVAKSSCIGKATWTINGIMNARMIVALNQKIGVQENDSWIVVHHELSNREKEFKRMADELHSDMHNPDSALKIFLKCSPDAVEHLLNRCLVNHCKDQVQGRIFFDFFLFYPPRRDGGLPTGKKEVGELTLLETLIEARKERFLTHPVFETFLKLKWYRTWRLYLVILFLYTLFVVSLLGYSLTHFGNVLDVRLDPSEKSPWWYFLAVTTTYCGLIEVCKFWYFCSNCASCPKEMWKRLAKDPSLAFFVAMGKIKDWSVVVFSAIVLSVSLDPEVRRYFAAVDVIVTCFNFMLALGRLPKIGIYIFMLNKVFGTMVNFLVTYFWHFLGYAVAFHILAPGDGEAGAFSTLGNSLVKVLTMLMGEYDFTDHFANEDTFWVSKIIFVIFVIDMSVVLMNLVLGLAVNDVDSIMQDSRVRSLVHETYTLTYLEEVCQTLKRVPILGKRYCPRTRIVTSNTCQFKEIAYLDVIDVGSTVGNLLVVDRSPRGGDVKSYPCPPTVSQSAVAIVKERLPVETSRPDKRTQTIIKELKDQNEQLQQKMVKMEDQLSTLIGLVSEMHSKMNTAEKE